MWEYAKRGFWPVMCLLISACLLAGCSRGLDVQEYLDTIVVRVNDTGLTMQDMIVKQFLPALMKYTDSVVASALSKKSLSAALPTSAEEKLAKTLSQHYTKISELNDKLAKDTKKAAGIEDYQKQAEFYHGTIIPDMEKLRAEADEAELLIPDDYLPYPTYEEMLFYV